MRRPCRSSRHGFTLVEILTATVLMIIIMMAVTVIFANVTDSIGQSRATLEMNQRLRATAAILKQDLQNVTAVMAPPRHPRGNEGYFEYVEGPIGPIALPSSVAVNSDREGEVNASGIPLDIETTLGDIDDILMFTATTKGEPYVGLIDGNSQVSNSAEIIWFIRGRTLYRRVLLIKPEINVRRVSPYGFYSTYDLSVHKTWDTSPVRTLKSGIVQNRPVLKANSLADLTTPSHRFAHHPDPRAYTFPRPTPIPGNVASTVLGKIASVRYSAEGKVFPHLMRPWLGAPLPGSIPPRWVPGLGLPILAESSTPYTEVWPSTYIPWVAGDAIRSEPPVGGWGIPNPVYDYAPNNPERIQMPVLPNPVEPVEAFDPWANGREHPWSNVDPQTGALADFRVNATRIGDDVIMTNVIGFDVKAWDPNAPVLTQSTGNPLNPNVVLMPGDPGYIDQVRLLQLSTNGSPPPFTISNFMPPLGAYVDLNYMAKVPRPLDASGNPQYYPDVLFANANGEILPLPLFGRQGNAKSLAYGTQWQFAMGEQPYPPSYAPYVKQPYEYYPAIYDTWSLEYEYNRHDVDYVSDNPGNANRPPSPIPVGNEDRVNSGGLGDTLFDEGSDGFDNDGTNGVDDSEERETQPPYAVPLQGIQVRIRAFEPGSRQVREVTLIQKFRTK